MHVIIFFSKLCANTIIRDAMLLMYRSVAAEIADRLGRDDVGMWLGLHRIDHRWLWTDNSAVDFIKWGPSEPNNQGVRAHCVVVFTYTYRNYELQTIL